MDGAPERSRGRTGQDRSLTVGEWRGLRLRDGTQAALLAIAEVAQALDAYRLSAAEADDARSEALERLWCHTPARDDRKLGEWAASAVRFAVKDVRRSGPRAVSPEAHQAATTLPCPRSWPREDEVERAEAHAALVQRVLSVSATLPRPHQDIVRWQFLEKRSRSQIGRLLVAWGGVSPSRCRGLLREAHALFREALNGTDLKRSHPRLFSKKSRWNSAPPLQSRHVLGCHGDGSA